ncbi:MAG: hypothetical protein ACI3ZI_01710 [Candidatus Cryptobacteroides sp.]
MKTKLLKLSSVIPAAVLALIVSGCTFDELYNAENILAVDKTVTLFEKGIALPLVQSTSKLRVDSIVKLSGLDTTQFGEYLKTDSEGNYFLSIEGQYSLDSMIDSLKLSEMVKIDAVDFTQDFSYDLGNIDASSLKVEAQSFGQTITLDDFSSALDISIDPVSESVSKKLGLASNDYSLDYSVDPVSRNQIIMSKSSIQTAAAAAAALGQSTVSFPDTCIPADFEAQNIPAVSLPSTIRSVSDVKLKSGAKMVVSISVSNCILSAGFIVPEISVDLSDVLVIEGVTGALDLSSLVLDKAGNFTARKEYNITGVNVSKLFSNKSIRISGNAFLYGATASCTQAQAIAGDLGLDVNIEFVNFGIEAVTCEINPVGSSVSQDVPINIPAITLPEQVKSVSDISFTDASQLDLTIKAKNLASITGLNASLATLTVQFPAALQVSGDGVSGNTLTITGANLASDIHKTVKISKINLPSPVKGNITWNDKISVTAEVNVSGTVNTALLPKTDAEDVVFEAGVVANLALADFNAVINPISQEVKIDETEIKMELPDGVGDFGTFTIIPEGNPAINISLSMPDLGGLAISAGEGVKVVLPDIVKFGSVPAALNYDQASHSITIRDIATANYSLPIEKLVVTPAKVDGKYLVSTKYSVNGTVGIAESAVNKATVDKLSGAQIAFQASIPELRAKSISIDELACNLDQSFKFNIMEAEAIPEMLVKVSEVELTDVKADLDLAIAGLPDIGSGKFEVDVTAKLPDFIHPSTIELKGEIGQDGKFSKQIAIEGFDLSSIDFQQLKADGKALTDSIEVSGKVYAVNPSINLNSLTGTITGSINAKIADSDNKIGVKSVRANVDYQLDTTMAFALNLGDALAGTVFDLPDVTLSADIVSNLAVPVNASASLNEGLYNLTLDFPYSSDPSETQTAANKFSLDLDPILNSDADTIKVDLKMALDKNRECYIETGADYTLDINYGISAPVQLGENFEYNYSDTLALGDAGKTLEEVLAYTNAGIKADVDNQLPLSVAIEAELLRYDEASDSYSAIAIQPVKSDALKAKTESKLELMLKASEGADLSGISHIRFSAKVTSNGDNLKESDYIMLKNVSVVVPDGVTINFDNLK